MRAQTETLRFEVAIGKGPKGIFFCASLPPLSTSVETDRVRQRDLGAHGELGQDAVRRLAGARGHVLVEHRRGRRRCEQRHAARHLLPALGTGTAAGRKVFEVGDHENVNRTTGAGLGRRPPSNAASSGCWHAAAGVDGEDAAVRSALNGVYTALAA